MSGCRVGATNTGALRRRVSIVAVLFLSVGLGWSSRADAACPFTATNDVALDAEPGLPLAYPGPL